MQLTAQAGELGPALGLAKLLVDDPKLSKIEALTAVRIRTGADTITITADVVDQALTITAPATIEAPADFAVPGERLAALINALPSDATVKVAARDKAVNIICGRSRYQLPTIPLADLPASLAIDHESGAVTLDSEMMTRLLEPAWAAAHQDARYYLCGILLHTVGGDLVSVATDGCRLVRVTVPAGELSSDHSLVIPNRAVAILSKILKATKPDTITLRRSRTLLEIETTQFIFVTKLIDGTFPSYETIVPPPSVNSAACDRAELIAALARLIAVAARIEKPAYPIAALEWGDHDGLRLYLARQPDDGHDVIAAETRGRGQIAVSIRQFGEFLYNLKAGRIRIEVNGHGAIAVRVAGDAAVLALQMPTVWNFARGTKDAAA